MPQYFDFQDQVRQDPEVVRLAEDWSVCMASQGYDYRDPQDARVAFQEQADTLITKLEARAGVDSEDFPGLWEQEQEVAVAEGRKPYDLSLEPVGFGSLEQVQDFLEAEKEFAAAEATCMEPLDERWTEIRRDYELRYV